jgi:hypothetical protein
MRKLYNPWTGPVQIIEKLSDTTIRIRVPKPNNPIAQQDVHTSRLRRYHAPFVQAHQRPGQPFAFPQTLLSRRIKNGTTQYRVRWVSLRHKPDSWINQTKLPDQLIQTFDNRGRRTMDDTIHQAPDEDV